MADPFNSGHKKFRERLLALPRGQKRLLQIAADVLLIWLSLWLAFFIRHGDPGIVQPFTEHSWLFLTAPAVAVPLFLYCGLYRAVMRYIGSQALSKIIMAVTASAALLALAVLLHDDPAAVVPRSSIVIYWLLSMLMIGGLRIVMRQYFNTAQFGKRPLPLMPAAEKRKSAQRRVVIYGSGAAGNQLLKALQQGEEMLVVGFIDDDPNLTGRIIAGLPVYSPQDIDSMIHDTAVQEVLLAIPSATRSRRREIIDMLEPHALLVRTVPGMMDLASGRVKVESLREVDIADLLGRDPVPPDEALFARCIRGKVVMVTGAGGSIGSELCRQVIRSAPSVLILFDHSEFGLYRIQQELQNHVKGKGSALRLLSVLGSVRNQTRLFDVMSSWQVDTVYHAAAYKHVPMVERNIVEGIINNTFGTLYTAQAALQAGVGNFVLISTDKAVRPTNVMGCTKRMAELVLQALATETDPCLYGGPAELCVKNHTRFTMVRFGNVLDSSGSVIPLFREQICKGGPVTVTRPEVTRYFMTIPEAAQLVIQAGALGQGGDVFVLDMGEPVKIAQLAEKMIQLSGLSVCSSGKTDGDIAIEYIGMRPGEKLYEELLIGENVSATTHPRIMRAHEEHLSWEQLKSAFTQLAAAIEQDNYPKIRELLDKLVQGYEAETMAVDWRLFHKRMDTADLSANKPPLHENTALHENTPIVVGIDELVDSAVAPVRQPV